MRLLAEAGFTCMRAAGSHGMFDVMGLSPTTVVLVQVKSGTARLSGLEREAIVGLAVPGCVSKEYWRFVDGSRSPLIERL